MKTDYEKPFSLGDFDCEHLKDCELYLMETVIRRLNFNRHQYLITGDKHYYWNMVELIPASYKGGKLWPK